MELPVLRPQPWSSLSTRPQQGPRPALSLTSILTSLDSFFLPKEDSTNHQSPGESSSRYRVLPSSPPLLVQQSHGSTNASTIPNITVSAIVDVPDDFNTTLVTARDVIPPPFLHFHGSTAGIGLAKWWSCKYCMISSSVYLLTNQSVFWLAKR